MIFAHTLFVIQLSVIIHDVCVWIAGGARLSFFCMPKKSHVYTWLFFTYSLAYSLAYYLAISDFIDFTFCFTSPSMILFEINSFPSL